MGRHQNLGCVDVAAVPAAALCMLLRSNPWSAPAAFRALRAHTRVTKHVEAHTGRTGVSGTFELHIKAVQMAQLLSSRLTGAPAIAGAKRVAPRAAFTPVSAQMSRPGVSAAAGAQDAARSAVVGQASLPGCVQRSVRLHIGDVVEQIASLSTLLWAALPPVAAFPAP